MSLFVFFISLQTVAQHVSGNHVPIIRSSRLRDFIALCWYVPWLHEGGQVRLVGSASMDGFVSQQKVTSSWFFLSTPNYDARSTTHQIYNTEYFENWKLKNGIFQMISKERQSSPVTGLEWPRVFQEVKVPRFRDNGTGWW